MTKIAPALCAIVLASALPASAQDCDCTVYPFRPNPPCYKQCVAKLSADRSLLGDVRGIDPGVAVGITVLSRSQNRDTVDFGSIKDKKTLEEAAYKVVKEQGESEAPPPPKDSR